MKKIKIKNLIYLLLFLFSVTISYSAPQDVEISKIILKSDGRFITQKVRDNARETVANWEKDAPITMPKLKKALAELKVAKENKDAQKVDDIEKSIKKAQNEIAGMLLEGYTLSDIRREFMEVIKPIAHNLKEVALYLLKILTVLEIVMLLVERPTEFPLSKVGATLIRWAILTFCITKWEYFFSVLRFDAIKIGGLAAGKNLLAVTPDSVFNLYGGPITASYSSLTITKPLDMVIWGILLLLPLCLAGFITIDLIMAELEYLIITGFSIILLPFMIWNKTAGIGGGIFRIFATLISKLMIMFFFIGFGTELLPYLAGLNFYTIGSFELLFKYTLVLFVIRTFVGRSQSIASMLVGGGGGSITGREVGGMVTGGIARTIGTLAAGLGLLALGKSAAGAAGNAATKSAGKLANTVKRATNMNLKKEENED